MNLKDIRSRTYFVSEALLAIFILFTLLVKVIDVKAIGPEGSAVGFAAINGAVSELLGYRAFFYKLAEILGLLILAIAAGTAMIGAYQLFQGKSLKAVDDQILILGAYYAVVFLLYILFDKIPLNYRPVILDAAEGLEPSYPSSHTMLAICVIGPALKLADSYVGNEKHRNVAKIGLIVLGTVTVAARLLSGAHWITDILGAVLISFSLVTAYLTLVSEIEKGSQSRGKHESGKGRHSA